MVEGYYNESSNITSMRLIRLSISRSYRLSVNTGSLRFRKRGILGMRRGNMGVLAGFGGFNRQNLNGWRCFESWSRFEFSDNTLERHYGVQTLFVESVIFFIGLQHFLRMFKNCLRFPCCFGDRVSFP